MVDHTPSQADAELSIGNPGPDSDLRARAVCFVGLPDLLFASWADEEYAVAYKPAQASTHLLDDLAHLILRVAQQRPGQVMSAADWARCLCEEADYPVLQGPGLHSLESALSELSHQGLLLRVF